MEFSNFQEWLVNEKGMSVRSARDVISRVRRVLNFSNTTEITNETLEKLTQSEDFKECSMYVKSQLRRSVALYNEFDN